MPAIPQQFLEAYLRTHSAKTVFTNNFPEAMKASEQDEDGWIEWKPISGTLTENEYHQIESAFDVQFPLSFINWHKAYYFLDCDTGLLRLPASNPGLPLESIRDGLNWYIPQQLIPQKLYPFAEDGNDTGPLVFDGREPKPGNEFPICVYDHEFGGDLGGLSPVIFSSFTKLLGCMIHYMNNFNNRKRFEIIPDFLNIDPEGAGKTGIDHWLGWSEIYKAEDF